jgi:hypothetical protein|tara:strand:+ start:202 stop:414 length:213 start_codon:yes stop_codon:yes gene_type:complete
VGIMLCPLLFNRPNPHSFITMTDLQLQALEVLELMEDNVEYICDQEKMSGEKVWTMIAALADAKLAQFPA